MHLQEQVHQRVEKNPNTKFLHAGRLREMEQNFAFCEWEPYIGTASEQKAKNAKSLRNSTFLRDFNNIIVKLCVEDAAPYESVITIHIINLA